MTDKGVVIIIVAAILSILAGWGWSYLNDKEVPRDLWHGEEE